MPAWQEYIAGTSPDNGNSVFAIMDTSNVLTNGLVIYWMSVTGKYYTIAESTNLFLGFSPLTSGIPATPPGNVYTSPIVSPGHWYYRIKVDQ